MYKLLHCGIMMIVKNWEKRGIKTSNVYTTHRWQIVLIDAQDTAEWKKRQNSKTEWIM